MVPGVILFWNYSLRLQKHWQWRHFESFYPNLACEFIWSWLFLKSWFFFFFWWVFSYVSWSAFSVPRNLMNAPCFLSGGLWEHKICSSNWGRFLNAVKQCLFHIITLGGGHVYGFGFVILVYKFQLKEDLSGAVEYHRFSFTVQRKEKKSIWII